MTARLEAKDLAVGYGRGRQQRMVLSGVNLAVQPGELVCLLGPNGVGKSTLMRTLSRSLPPLAGTVSIDGREIVDMLNAELARNVGVVLTERIAIGAMPALRLVELGRYPHVNWAGHLSDTDRDIVREAIAAVGATPLAQRDVNELSDGERQRIMIARALAQRPAVLLLDEPSAYLDVSGRVELIAMLRRLAHTQAIAIILSSHDLELSLRTADTIWLLDGKGGIHVGAPEDLVADGSIASVFSGPNVSFSALDRSFKIKSAAQRKAWVTGDIAQIDLAGSVLEREGFVLTTDLKEAQLALTFDRDGWTAEAQGRTERGKSFVELAQFARSASEGGTI